MTDGQHTENAGAAAPPLETLAERLRALESQLAAIQSRGPPGPLPAGYAAPNAPGVSYAAAVTLLPALAGGFWKRFAFLRELRLIVGMYVDARYRVSRLTQLAAPGLLAVMVGNYFFFNWLMVGVPLLTPILERLVLIALAVALYQVLSREAARYGDVLAYLTNYGR